MKPLILMILITHTLPCYSQVFKCKSSSGNTIYQSKKCSSSSRQKKIVIKPFDPEQILKAQQRLRLQLIQRKHAESARKRQELQNQQIEALKAQTQSAKELAEALRENSEFFNAEKPTTEHYYYFNKKYPRYHPKKQKGKKPSKYIEKRTFNPPGIR